MGRTVLARLAIIGIHKNSAGCPLTSWVEREQAGDGLSYRHHVIRLP